MTVQPGYTMIRSEFSPPPRRDCGKVGNAPHFPWRLAAFFSTIRPWQLDKTDSRSPTYSLIPNFRRKLLILFTLHTKFVSGNSFISG
jgi:hypothetical protein